MGILEITLLAAGAIIFIVSFCIPVKEEKLKEETRNLAAEEVKNLVSKELESIRDRLEQFSEEEMKEQIRKSERSMERISNEKIMAVNEYSDTVLEEIHKNHEEVVFLYDMLKNKKAGLTESYERADQNVQKLLQQVKDSEITVQENLEKITLKQKELEETKRETTVDEVPEKKRTAPVRRSKKAVTEKEPGKEIIPEQKAVSEGFDFRPFTPEKIEAVPKKSRAGEASKKPETESVSSSGNAELMLLLSDTMEDSQGGNSNERILKLHRAGKSNMAIARELGLGIGEVKLVIDLYEGLQ